MSDGLSEHLSLLACAPDGIKKLRGLILELAVRGKLVSQEPKDEPASELVKRIAAEKARLVADGMIKKGKPLPPVREDEKPFKLPTSWQWVRLGEVTNFGQTDKSGEILDNTWVLCLEDIEKDTSVLLRKVRFSERQAKSDKNRFIAGDVLYGKLRPYLNKVIVADEDGVCTTEILPVRSFSSISPRFLMHALKRPDFLAYVNSKSYGMKMPRLGTEDGRTAIFPLPPLAEQHRIVAKVDELMALCDRMDAEQADAEAAHATLVQTLLGTLTQSRDATGLAANWQRLSQYFDTLFTTETSLDTLKQTILQLAVMGKLAPQDSSDEPASKLLKRIAAEKARLLAEGKIRKDKPLPPVGDAEKPFTVPTGWEWVRFERVAISRLGKMLDKAKNRGLLKPYLRNTNVQWWRFDLDDVKELRLDPAELEEYQLLAGDLLICEGGEPGRCAIWQGIIEEMYFQKAIHRARPCGGVMPEYLQICLRVDAVSGALDQYFTGATIKHFSGEKLASYVLSLPPVEEQHRIVAKVDELMVLCDSLKANLAKSRARQARLATTLIESALQAV